MNNFLEYLKKENIIEEIIEIYRPNLKEETPEIYLKKINLYLVNNPELKEESGFDVFGNIHQNSLNRTQKKKLGEFYTPFSVVNYILDSTGYTDTNNIENKKLIDISCGSGSFIIQAIRRLLNRHLKILKSENLLDLTLEEMKDIVLNVKENIYGVDVNPFACILCQLNINYVLYKIFEKIRKLDENYKLPRFCIKNFNTLELENYDQYDFVVGNPPYLFIRDIPNDHKKLIDTKALKTNKGQYDYYQIFLELGIKFLKNGGKLGYIIPDSLLALSHRSIARKYVYNYTKIKEIYYTGPKFDDTAVSNIIIILQKENNEEKREKNVIKIKLSNTQIKQIYQSSIKKWDFKFLIHLNQMDVSIIEKINMNIPKLKELNKKKGFKILLSRGVELAKSGEIIYCGSCDSYFPVPKKHLICPGCQSKLKSENIEKIIYSKIPKNKEGIFKKFLYSINRYKIKDKKYIDVSKKGINYKDFNFYEDRIVIRQLSQNNLICASYDQEFSLNSQSFYNLKVIQSPLEEFNHFYLLGIINSQLISYYFFKCFGSYKQLFPRILIEKILNLPIKIPNNAEEKTIAVEITEYVKKILEKKNMSKKNMKQIQELIDRKVFEIYNIPKLEQDHILTCFQKI
jgi:methylase of polypeptide subunit release factors